MYVIPRRTREKMKTDSKKIRVPKALELFESPCSQGSSTREKGIMLHVNAARNFKQKTSLLFSSPICDRALALKPQEYYYINVLKYSLSAVG